MPPPGILLCPILACGPYHPAMFDWLSHLRPPRSRPPPLEPSRVIIGSTGSGKSEGELVDLVRLSRTRAYAVVLLDGHGPLALRAAGHWAARGHESRLIYEPLDATDRVLCWNMLPKSSAATLSRRRIEDAETKDEVAQCLMAQRNLDTLSDKPATREWLDAALSLCLGQPTPEPLASLPSAFRIGSQPYERLLGSCEDGEVAGKFRNAERLRRKSEVQYEIQTGAARRLLEQVCDSEVVRLRSRPGPFQWLEALQQQRLIAFDGGGIRSREIKRTLFLLVSIQVIQAVRRHFAQTQQPLRVVLVLEEAGALGLVTPFILHALQELRKAGLAIHVLTQSSVDFGDRALFESILANSPWQAWYQVLSPSDQELGARVLTNATFDSLSVHYTRTRALQDGVERMETVSRGQSFDPHTRITLREDRRTGTALHTRYRYVSDAAYKAPLLVEQEYRTQLATLRIGERLVRDRGGVRRERVKPVRPPWLRRISDADTRSLIERLRTQAIYQPCPAPEVAPVVNSRPDAASRLRDLMRG